MATTNMQLPTTTEKPETPTWVSHVLIPLTQNIVGGLACTTLTTIATYAVAASQARPLDAETVALWNGLVGAVVAASMTVIRFFGDDIGLLQIAYRAGAASRDDEVNALQLEMEEAQRLIDQLNGVTISSGARDELIDRCQRSREHALELVRRRLAGEEYRRKQLNASKAMNQHDWNRAYALLCQAGVIDRDTKKMGARTVHEAQRLIDPVYENGLQLAKRGGRPAWLMA